MDDSPVLPRKQLKLSSSEDSKKPHRQSSEKANNDKEVFHRHPAIDDQDKPHRHSSEAAIDEKDVFHGHPALDDQGKHEIEVFEHDYESAITWKLCVKNPGHKDFIPASMFAMDDLPEKFRNEDIFRFIQLWAALTVKLTIKTTSNERTPDDAFYFYRGSSMFRTGTGKVTDVYTYDEDADVPCPCTDCLKSKTPLKKWKAVWIMTAKHVVFDEQEVEKTSAEFFYDSDELKGSTVRLEGLRVVDLNRHGDWCKFECVTHDLDFAKRIEDALDPMIELGAKIQDKFGHDPQLNLTVIASHPHGCAKKITVGEWKNVERFERADESLKWTTYSYSTATCRGSSGAPVWIIGSDRGHMYAYYSHVHSEGGNPALGEPNKSGAGDVVKTWEI